MYPITIFFRNPLISLEVVIENSCTYPQELILLNILFSPEPSDYGITYIPDYIVETDVNIDTFKHLLTS